MKTIEEKIKEINAYFAEKITNGDYEIIFLGCDEITIEIKIDCKYEFTLWVSKSNGWGYFGIYDTKNAIKVSFTDFQKMLGFAVAIHKIEMKKESIKNQTK